MLVVGTLRGGRVLLTEMMLPRIVRQGTVIMISYTITYYNIVYNNNNNNDIYIYIYIYVKFQYEDKLDKLELINFSSIWVSDRIIHGVAFAQQTHQDDKADEDSASRVNSRACYNASKTQLIFTFHSSCLR